MDDATRSLPHLTPWRPPIRDDRIGMVHIHAMLRALAEARQRIMQRAEYVAAGEKYERQLAKRQATIAKRRAKHV